MAQIKSDYIRTELEDLKSRITKNIRSSGEWASGRTADSMKVETVGDTIRLVGRGFFATLEHGRCAGKGPMGFQSIIRQWILDKGISYEAIPYMRQASANWQPKYSPDERGLQAISGAIAHSIVTKGTKLHRTGGRSDVYSTEIPVTTTRISQKLGADMALEFNDLNKKLRTIMQS